MKAYCWISHIGFCISNNMSVQPAEQIYRLKKWQGLVYSPIWTMKVCWYSSELRKFILPSWNEYIDKASGVYANGRESLMAWHMLFQEMVTILADTDRLFDICCIYTRRPRQLSIKVSICSISDCVLLYIKNHKHWFIFCGNAGKTFGIDFPIRLCP